jgi:hypothetical protein
MIKKRIIFLIAIVSLICITSATLNVKAHNPAYVNLSYNSNSEVLVVTISHEVSNTSSHYIDSVYITVNGSMVVDELYTSQPQNTFVYMYYFTANEGARIQVTATCNLGGDITECIIVGNGSCPQTIDIPGYYGIMLIIAISAIILSMITFKNIKKRLR